MKKLILIAFLMVSGSAMAQIYTNTYNNNGRTTTCTTSCYGNSCTTSCY